MAGQTHEEQVFHTHATHVLHQMDNLSMHLTQFMNSIGVPTVSHQAQARGRMFRILTQAINKGVKREVPVDTGEAGLKMRKLVLSYKRKVRKMRGRKSVRIVVKNLTMYQDTAYDAAGPSDLIEDEPEIAEPEIANHEGSEDSGQETDFTLLAELGAEYGAVTPALAGVDVGGSEE